MRLGPRHLPLVPAWIVRAAALALVLVLPQSAPAQPPPAEPGAAAANRHPEEGRPLIRTYRPIEVGGGSQTWAIVQDARGVIYAGTAGTVLEFDGAVWRRIPLEQQGQTVRSLAVDGDGRIYVGAQGDFGYLAPDGKGELQFVSLLEKVPAADRDFNDVWRTWVLSDGAVIFQTERMLFRWADGAITVIPAASRFGRVSAVRGRLYVPTPETGLSVLEGTRLRPLPNTLPLAGEPYPIVLAYDETGLLIGTRQNGLFLYDGTGLAPFPTELDPIFTSGQLYRGIVLPDGTFAFSTTSRGMGVVDRRGRRVAAVDRSVGLPTDVVYYAAADREGALWLGLDIGIARVETPSAVSFFGQEDGLPGTVYHIHRHGQRLYAGLQTGVAYLVPAAGPTDTARFVEAEGGAPSQCWDFVELPGAASEPPALVVACSSGLYEVAGTRLVPIKELADLTFRPATLHRSTADPTRIWVGKFDGLTSFRRTNGRWVDEGDIAGLRVEVRSVRELADGNLWLGGFGSGIQRVLFASRPGPDVPRPPARVEHFDAANGLPPVGGGVEMFDGTPYFSIGYQDPFVARFDEATRTFVRETSLDVVGVNNVFDTAIGLARGSDGKGYLNWGRETAVVERQPGGAWTIDRATFGRFGVNLPPVYLEAEPGGVVWVATLDGRLARFDTARPGRSTQALPALIRRVSAHTRPIFGGGTAAAASPELAARDNALRFEFAAPSFLDETATEYQSRLDGLDGDWSEWTREARRDYTNLGHGSYTFRVRARNVLGEVGREAAYAFVILPPWYRTWWAYAAYILLAGLLALTVDRLQRRRLVARERQRAQMAEARLRAEAAEALARTESEGKRNIELLSEIGREITASLDFDTIFGKLYERLNELADADVFGVGLYHPERHEIEYRLAIENGKRYTPYSRDTTDRNQLPVWCIEHREPVFINDLDAEVGRYVRAYDEQQRPLEDGTLSKRPQSIIYMPLLSKGRVLGIVTIQSFQKHAYTEHHRNVMQSLASYTAIALDNADAYRQLNEQEHEIRRLFEEAEHARTLAEEADAAKSAFLSTVSHELRTPLTSVLGFAKIIKKRLEERIFPLVQSDDRKIVHTLQQVQDNLAVVVSEGERLTKLIDDVLDLAKIESGKLEWHMGQVSMAEVVEHATSATASLFEQRGLQLVKDVAPDLPAVTGDRDRLVQVVINLISNAVKFTDAGTVTCRAAQRDGEIVVSVIDTGVGIAPADHAKVFERFKQVGDTLTDKPKGTGLGLPICREIVEHHGGRIWVESAAGRGSTFAFTLPVTVEHRAGVPAPVELAALIRQLRDHVVVTTPRTADRQPHILVVDDDPHIRELLTQELTDAGYGVNVAANGREALREVRRDRPDLVVLDVMMPEMNGFDVAAVLKNDPKTMDIPIVILSIVQDRERGFRIGVDRYLTKPIDTELLFREVGALIEQRKSRKHVLVVDDDASTVKTLSDVLRSRGYSVMEANGSDLLARARELQPDIIMLNSVSSARSDAVQMLRFEKGMENVLFLVYQ